MTIYTNTFEGGTHGAAITLANSGGASGTALGVAPQPTTGEQWTYSTTAALQGVVGAQRTLDTTAGYLRFDDPAPGGRGGMRRPFYVEATPAANVTFGQIRTAADGLVANVLLRTTRVVRVAPAGVELAASDSPPLTVGQWYWVEVIATPGTTTSDGRIEVGIWDSTGALVHSYDSGATVNTTTAAPARYRFGGFSTASGFMQDRMDSVRWGSLASGWIGGVTAAPHAAHTLRTTQVVDLTASTDATSLEVTQTSGPTVAVTITGLVVTFDDDATRTQPVVLEVTLTGPGGTDAVTVTVPPAGSGVVTIRRRYWDGVTLA